jgi:hypothetical protein
MPRFGRGLGIAKYLAAVYGRLWGTEMLGQFDGRKLGENVS